MHLLNSDREHLTEFHFSMVNSMVIRLFYYTLCRADQGHRTLLGADMTHTRAQSQTRTHHFHLKNQKMERSARTHAEGFQLSATNVKIDWRKPFRLADTLLTKIVSKDCVGRG